tara:strand:+ start:1908 stop:2204 length:297 start_codon:yes stop_codon:yes gene_type:complete
MDSDLYNYNAYIITYDKDNQTSLERVKNSYIVKSNEDKVHTVIEGERLDTISYKYYGDSKFWWAIADTNDIKDTLINPFQLTSGTKLLIPDLQNFLSQ